MSIRIGKPLESAARKLRAFLLPSYRSAYAKLLARGMSQRREGEPIVCCDFSNTAIDAVGGRYYFSLVRDLMDAGYFPVFTARRRTLSTFGTSAIKSLLLTERLGVIRSPDDLKEAFFLITDDLSAVSEHAEKIVRVTYEVRIAETENDIAFPFFVHPWIASLPLPKEKEERTARLFFGGNTTEKKYDNDVIRDFYGMLSRREVLEVVADAISADRIYKPTDASQWLESDEFHPYVFCETQHCKIPPDRWLEALAKADFFLACPGVGMPLCHNVIEALAAGAIPILQYAAYLTAPLEDRINALTFDSADSLREAVKTALEMSPEEVLRMRANVNAYYRKHYAPGCFTRRLFDGTASQKNLLLNAYRVPR